MCTVTLHLVKKSIYDRPSSTCTSVISGFPGFHNPALLLTKLFHKITDADHLLSLVQNPFDKYRNFQLYQIVPTIKTLLKAKGEV